MRFSLPLLVILATLGGCCSDPVDGSSYFCLGDMSVAEELELGSSYAPNIDAMYGGVYADADADQYLGGLIREMASHSVYGPEFKWTFTILNTSIPNAFAVPGGYIYITRGLLAAMETEGQFISVMGHELGHVEHRHSHKGMGKQALGSVVVGVLNTGIGVATQTEPPPIIGGVLNAGAGLVLLSYSRDQELQADSRGVYYSATMGYDPMEGVKTFEYFKQLEAESGGGNDIEFLRTHPLNDRRIDDIKAEVQQTHPELLSKPHDSFRPYKDGNTRFQQIVGRIAKAQPVYDDYDKAVKVLNEGAEKKDNAAIASALSTLQSCASRIPDEILFQTGVGAANLELGKLSPAKTALSRAIQLDNAYLPARRYFQPHYLMGGLSLQNDDFASAKQAFSDAADAFPMYPATHYYLGLSYEGLGDKSRARAAYEKAIEVEGDASGKWSTQAGARLKKL